MEITARINETKNKTYFKDDLEFCGPKSVKCSSYQSDLNCYTYEFRFVSKLLSSSLITTVINS